MATPTIAPPNPDEDTRNPGVRHAANQFNEQQATARELADIEKNYGADADPTQENANIARKGGKPNNNIGAAQAREAQPSWNSTFGQSGKKKQKVNFFKRKGPLAAIVTLLVGGGVGGSFFLSAGLLPFDFRATMAEKFNSQAKVLSERNFILLQKKLTQETTTGICTSVVNIKCRLATMSNRQVKKFEEAGIKVNTDGKTYLKRRHKAVSFEYQGRTITAETLRNELKDPDFLKAVRHAYNPIIAGYVDKVFDRWAQKRNLGKQKNITGDTDAERRQSIQKAASGQLAIEHAANVTKTEDCSDGPCRNVYRDSSGKEISESEYNLAIENTSAFDAQVDALKKQTSPGEAAGVIAKTTTKGILTSTAFGLGALDSACTGYNFIRTVTFAAQFIGMTQVMRGAFAFVNSIDAIRAGDGTAGDATFINNTLTSVNQAGLSATDSPGYHYAKYDDVGGFPSTDNLQSGSINTSTGLISLSSKEVDKAVLVNETTKYINGQMVSSSILGALLTQVGATSTAAADEACDFIKGGWGQTIIIGAAVAGAAVAFFSGGATLSWGLAAQTGVSIALGVAMTMLTPKLTEMLAGTLINGNENGYQVGNYVTSGMGAFDAQTSQARGIPALTKEDAIVYEQETEELMARQSELERLDANPLDYTTRHTFLGSIAYSLSPYSSKINDLPTAVTSVAQFTKNTFARIIPSVGAADPGAEYEICQDATYTSIGVAVDPNCNIKHGMSNQTLSIPTDTVVHYMQDVHHFADPITGEPTDDNNEYAEYLKNCPNRDIPIGSYTDDNPDKGEDCIQKDAATIIECSPDSNGNISPDDPCNQNCTTGNNSQNAECRRNMFRLYPIDISVNDVMDDPNFTDDDVATAIDSSQKTTAYHSSNFFANIPTWIRRIFA